MQQKSKKNKQTNNWTFFSSTTLKTVLRAHHHTLIYCTIDKLKFLGISEIYGPMSGEIVLQIENKTLAHIKSHLKSIKPMDR